ncbi:endo alpha-1,4 polygalactosaminidase [Deinococcus sp.]|uniref:endo alpha-1,4 polygalactosaminidase n=1 Tax=Deinococcus sp. TaxID=47478 RepID=UPI003B5B6D36
MPGQGGAGRRALAVYYGPGSPEALSHLARAERVVVEPGHFPPDKVAWLRARGVQVLAYLSLGEMPHAHSDVAPAWTRGEHQATWGTLHVDLAHPDWRAQIQAQVLEHRGTFDGFFLDTLDGAMHDPRQFRAMLKLIRAVRQWAGPRYLLANRGVSLLGRLRGTLNGVLIEGCSTTWEGGYRRYIRHELDYTEALVRQVQRFKLEVYALDYANSPELRRFAVRRAAKLGIPTFVSNRELTLSAGYPAKLPAGAKAPELASL